VGTQLTTVGSTPTESEWSIYWQFTRFLWPLVLTAMAQEVSAQVVSSGTARVPQAVETLAGYGLAWGIVTFLFATFIQTRQLSLVLVDSRAAFHKVHLFIWLAGLLFGAVLAGLTFGPQSVWVIEKLHGISQPLGNVVRQTILWFIPVPLLIGLIYFYSGLLVRMHRTDLISYATVAGIGANFLTVIVLLPTNLVQRQPILLPILVTYAGIVAEVGIVLWGYRRYVSPRLVAVGQALSLTYVAKFYWPLALIMAIQGVSRPLINLFVSWGPNATAALAVLTVAYTLGRIPYGWLNEIRNLAPAFREKTNGLWYIRRFVLACAVVSLIVMYILFWTPLRVYILETMIGLDAELTGLARMPLLIFTFFALPVAMRAYFHGVALLERRTQALAPSAPARIVAILLALFVLPSFGVQGAPLGVAALLSGFTGEALVVWWGIHGFRFRITAGKGNRGSGE
jgi:hypothetical protein